MQNDVDNADGAQLLIEKDTHEQMCARIGNYDIATETRELKIQWGKVKLLRHERHRLKRKPPIWPDTARKRRNYTRESNKHEWKPNKGSCDEDSKNLRIHGKYRTADY